MALQPSRAIILDSCRNLVGITGEIADVKFQALQARDVRNVEIQFNGAMSSQVSEAAKDAVAKNASASAIVRPILKGSLHPSTSRGDIDIRDVLALRDKFNWSSDSNFMSFHENVHSHQVAADWHLQRCLRRRPLWC